MEYLGVKPDTYSEGVLQDIHWAAGYFGFFPSYLYSNIYASQIYHYLNVEMSKSSDVSSISDKLKYINTWLKANLNNFGSLYGPDELIKIATGESINVDYYLQYINNKFIKNIY